MYDSARLRYPLKRVGQRGGGTWKRVSWEDALRDIADRSIDVLSTNGPAGIIWEPGGANQHGCNAIGLYRTSFVLDTPVLAINQEVGDHHPGATVTCGKIIFSGSGDDLFHSDLILIWGGNPVFSQIPNAHFVNEARYRGVQIVTIAPDYNASAIHADRWIPVAIGTDAALGLALAHVIVEEDLLDRRFVAEQTDLPLLVRTDTRRFLRASDLARDGDEAVFHVFDRTSGEIRAAAKRSLALDGVEPALEGEYTVETAEGEVTVTPVFELLRRRLREYPPDVAEKITGTSAGTIRDLARQIASAQAATFLTQTSFSKFYHGLEMERAQILVLTLCGQIGKKGSGITGFPYLGLAGVEGLYQAPGNLPPSVGLLKLGLENAPTMIRGKLAGHSLEMILGDLGRAEHAGGALVSASLFFHRHGGLAESTGSAKRYDPWLKREFDEFLDDALAERRQFVPDECPRIFFAVGGNMLRRVRGYDKLIESFLPKLDLLVTLDWRMSNTARYSDYVLPAAGWYERDDITWATPIAPFAHAVTRATEPLAESKSDWEFHCLYLKAIAQRAAERGVASFEDRRGAGRRLDQVYDEFTFNGRYTEDNPEDLLEEIFSIASNVGDTTWKAVKQKGFERYTGIGMSFSTRTNATDIEPGETITANTWHTRDKMPWPTLTRRLQFYIDDDVFMELGEELPVHKDNPPIGGDYPLSLTGGHTRWSIHGMWQDEDHLLRLQRGEPLVFMGKEDAAARGIRDGDPVRMWNDVGSCRLQVRISAAVRPGQVIVYHGWEPFQFEQQRSHRVLFPSPMNPVQAAGGYYHLRPAVIMGDPGVGDRGTRVEVERIHS
jgi:DMSO reductase family type II enzyme molybdopterin subunit